MTGVRIGIAVALLAGALVSVAVSLYRVATGDDLDATGMKAVEDEEDGK